MTARNAALFTVWLTALCFVHPVETTLTLSVPDPVVQVKETETRQLALNPNPITCTDSDGDATRVYWKSTTPTRLCGACFHVWPNAAGTGYDLVFIPSFGSLNYDVQTSYLVILGCTDDNEGEVTGLIEVRIDPNTSPAFTSPNSGYDVTTISGTSNKRFGEEIYDVDADDVDGDPITYTMSEDPATGLFDIGYANGRITAKKDLRLLCESSVNFYVTASDSYNPPVGPVVIDTTFNKINLPPQVPADVTIQIPEDTAVDSDVYTLNVIDDDVYPELYYKMRATPERGLEYYYLDTKPNPPVIKTRDILDYEYADLRTVTLTIDVSDGFCDGPSQEVTIEITDVNEIPVIDPDYKEITVYEGFITVDPEWNLIDPDLNDKHTWSLVRGGGGKFEVDEDSGNVFSIKEIDLDPDKVSQNYNMEIRVTDQDNKRDFADIKITVMDKNDNAPEFNTRQYSFGASPCSKVGKILGYVRATDRDSEYQGNNHLVYSGFSTNMSVMADGAVILTQPCLTEGAFDSLSADVTDQGQYPGPLQGVPVPVTLTCGPCPSPVPATTTASTTTGAAIDTGNSKDFFDANLGWLVPAIILGIILLGLLAYFLWRYCARACANWRAGRAIRGQRPVEGKQQKPRPTKEEKKAQKDRPKPPEPPAPEPEPFFFGFWKETFPDRDQRHTPKRDVKPASVAADKQAEEKEKAEEAEEKKRREMERQKEVDKYNQELQQYYKKIDEVDNPQSAPPKKKRCTIL